MDETPYDFGELPPARTAHPVVRVIFIALGVLSIFIYWTAFGSFDTVL